MRSELRRRLALVAASSIALHGCWLLASHEEPLVTSLSPSTDAAPDETSAPPDAADEASFDAGGGRFCRAIDAAFCEDFEGDSGFDTEIKSPGCGEVRLALEAPSKGRFLTTIKGPDAGGCTAAAYWIDPLTSVFKGSFRVALDVRLRAVALTTGVSLFAVHQRAPGGMSNPIQARASTDERLSELSVKVGDASTSTAYPITPTASLGEWRHVVLEVDRGVSITLQYRDDEGALVERKAPWPDAGYPPPDHLSVGVRNETGVETTIDFDNIVVEAR